MSFLITVDDGKVIICPYYEVEREGEKEDATNQSWRQWIPKMKNQTVFCLFTKLRLLKNLTTYGTAFLPSVMRGNAWRENSHGGFTVLGTVLH